MNNCKYLIDNERLCQAMAMKESIYCFRHNPETKDAQILASSKGGSNRNLSGIYGEPVNLESPRDVKNFLSKVINAVWSEGVPVQVGSSMGFLTRCWLDAYEASDVTKRIEEIEDKLSRD